MRRAFERFTAARLAGLLGILCLLWLAATAGAIDIEGDDFTADHAAAEFQRQGLTLTPQGIADLKWFEKYRKSVSALYRNFAACERAYQTKEMPWRVAEIRRHKETLRFTYRTLPSYRLDPAFMLALHNYKASNQFKHSNQYIAAARRDLPLYEKEVAGLAARGGSVDDSGRGAPSGGHSGGGRSAADLEVYVINMAGDMEFYVNNQKVEHRRQAFPLNGSREFTLRVVALGAKRKSNRALIPPPNTTIELRDDYQLKYETVSGSFRGATHWTVAKESYAWAVTRAPNVNAHVTYTAGGRNGVAKDAAVFALDGAFSFGATVRAQTEWKARSERPGGARSMEQTDQATGSIELAVSPRG